MKVLIPLIVPLFFYGCFGSDDNASTSLSGTVADGYIENATVCFDSNGNLSCDDGEPTTTTDAEGKYSVTANGSTAGLSVIAVVGPDSKDADDNGQTMSEAGKEGFNFMAPAENPTVVSPLSTLIQFEIISNPTFSLDQAQNAVKETLQIDNDDVNLLEYDFVKEAEGGNSFATNIKNVTEVLSSALGDVTKNMNDSLSSLDDFGTDNGKKSFQTGIMDMIKETVIPATVKDGAVNGTVDDLKKQLKGAFRPNDCGANDCEKSGALVAGFQSAVSTKIKAVKVAVTSGEQKVSDIKAVMENGIVIGYPSSHVTYEDANGCEQPDRSKNTDPLLVVESIKMGNDGEYNETKVLVDGKWYNKYFSKYDDWSMNPKNGVWAMGEIPHSSGGHEAMPQFSDGCMTFSGDFSEKICFKERNLAGKTIATVLCPDGTSDSKDEFCYALDGKNSTFQDGSLGIDVAFSYDFDLYRANIANCLQEEKLPKGCSTGYNDKDGGSITTIDGFITAHEIGTHSSHIGNSCNVAFAFDKANKQIYYLKNTKGCGEGAVSISDGKEEGIEKLSYEIKAVDSSQVLISGLPQMYVEQNPNEIPTGGSIMFAAIATDFVSLKDENNTTGAGLFFGTYVPNGVTKNFSFDTGEQKIGTEQFLNSISEAQGWDKFPYPTKVRSNEPPTEPTCSGR